MTAATLLLLLSLGAPEPAAGPQTACAPAAPRTPVRRLNAREYAHAVRALLGAVTVPPRKLPVDVDSVKDFDTDGSALFLLDLDANKYWTVARAAVDEALARGGPPDLRALLRRAFRRPPTPAEVARYERLARTAPDRAAGLRRALVAALMSPDFLFVGGRDLRDPWARAERLALFLWSSLPDERLLALAETGALARTAVLEEEVARMLADPAAAAFTAGFAKKWLTLDDLGGVLRDPRKFPAFSPALLASMERETELFFQDVLASGRPLLELITARHSFVDERLAALYGIDGVHGPEFRRVELPAAERRGLLTHASVLTRTGATTTSPAHRGYWVTRKITCTEPPPPPPNVPALPDARQGLSLKERLEDHRLDVGCAACHRELDPIGIGLERYDGIGRWRTSYGALPVEADDEYHGRPFDGPIALIEILSEGGRFARCLAENLATYALGRLLSPDERCHVAAAVAAAEARGGSLVALVQALVTGPLFGGEAP